MRRMLVDPDSGQSELVRARHRRDSAHCFPYLEPAIMVTSSGKASSVAQERSPSICSSSSSSCSSSSSARAKRTSMHQDIKSTNCLCRQQRNNHHHNHHSSKVSSCCHCSCRELQVRQQGKCCCRLTAVHQNSCNAGVGRSHLAAKISSARSSPEAQDDNDDDDDDDDDDNVEGEGEDNESIKIVIVNGRGSASDAQQQSNSIRSLGSSCSSGSSSSRMYHKHHHDKTICDQQQQKKLGERCEIISASRKQQQVGACGVCCHRRNSSTSSGGSRQSDLFCKVKQQRESEASEDQASNSNHHHQHLKTCPLFTWPNQDKISRSLDRCAAHGHANDSGGGGCDGQVGGGSARGGNYRTCPAKLTAQANGREAADSTCCPQMRSSVQGEQVAVFEHNSCCSRAKASSESRKSDEEISGGATSSSDECATPDAQPIYQQIVYREIVPHSPASQGKRLISRSGSQCSSVSTASSSVSTTSSSSVASRSSAASNHRLRLISESSSINKFSNNPVQRRHLMKVETPPEDENNNTDECPNAYADTSSFELVDPKQQLQVTSPTITLAAGPPAPPPPPPPPPMPKMPLASVASQPMDLVSGVLSVQLRPTSQQTDQDTTSESSEARQQASKQAGKRAPSGGVALPAFIPPQFSSPPQDGTNIKPSEYLKRMASNSALNIPAGCVGKQVQNVLNATSSTNNSNIQTAPSTSPTSTPTGSYSQASGASLLSTTSSTSSNERRFERHVASAISNHQNRFSRPIQRRQMGELVRSQSTSALGRIDSDVDDNDNDCAQSTYSTNSSNSATSSNTHTESHRDDLSERADTTDTGATQQINDRLMSAICNNENMHNDLNNNDPESQYSEGENRQLSGPGSRSTRVQADASAQTRENLQMSHLFAAKKRDLIAELKESRGLDGIKQMKETCRNKGEMQKLVASMVPAFKPEDFLDKVTTSEPSAPLWRRQMLAKKAAERARKECEEKLRVELEEQRLSQVPAWKRQMLAKKAAEKTRKDDEFKVKRDSEERRFNEMPAWRRQLAKVKMTASTGNVNDIGNMY